MSNDQMMGILNLEQILDALRMAAEDEVVEFKSATNTFDFNKLGKYFSAISNEANLRDIDYGWLLFGVENNNHDIVGTNFRSDKKDLNSLKKEIADKTTNRLTFNEIHEVIKDGKRVLMFQIPAAPKGIPISFNGHYYGRDNESLVALNIKEIETIRNQAIHVDWSAEVVPDATIEDLDEEAITIARRNYKSKFPEKAEDVDSYDNITFLNKAKITRKGQITRTAIILLGKEESEHFLSPADLKIRWKLVDENNIDIDYEIFGIPFLLSVDKVFSKIRNIKYRYMQPDSIFPEEVQKYEPYSIREALNNCIAHQDYTKCARINVIEMPDQLIFTNAGEFIPGSVEKVVFDDAPEDHYRNHFLATAMFNLKMVDTAGGGIKKIFNFQRARFFPLPDYELNNERVKVEISGKVLDMDYARLLIKNKELTLPEIMMLDKVQKKKLITKNEASHLKSKGLIEGKHPNYFISLKVAKITGQKAEYTKNKALDKAYYLTLIQQALKQHKNLKRSEIDELLKSKLPDVMSEKQKKFKINNLISELSRDEIITNIGTTRNSVWILLKKD